VTGQSGGTAKITAKYTDKVYTFNASSGCTYTLLTMSASSSATVQVPTSLSTVAGTSSTTSESSCSAGSAGTGCGVTRSFTYQVMDQENPPKPIAAPGIASLQFWDAIQTSSPNGLGITGYITTCSPANTGPCGAYVQSNGQFKEKGLFVCSTVCRPSGTCVTGGSSYTAANQTVHVGPYPIVQSISYYCNGVLVNGQ
jgi:hypothetical protein